MSVSVCVCVCVLVPTLVHCCCQAAVEESLVDGDFATSEGEEITTKLKEINSQMRTTVDKLKSKKSDSSESDDAVSRVGKCVRVMVLRGHPDPALVSLVLNAFDKTLLLETKEPC